jgi:hypothetical protein
MQQPWDKHSQLFASVELVRDMLLRLREFLSRQQAVHRDGRELINCPSSAIVFKTPPHVLATVAYTTGEFKAAELQSFT